MNEIATGWICTTPIYEFEGWKFEYHPYMGTWPLKKDLEPRKRAGRRFYAVLGRFLALPEDEQEQYRIGGGCIQI